MTGPHSRVLGGSLLAIALIGAAGPVHAEKPASGAGVEAFVRGDFVRAVQLLQPIAERWTDSSDDAARFFMAAAYWNGLGVPRDPVKACALHLSAARHTTPFARINASLFASLLPSLSPDQQADCRMLALIGFGHRFEPVTFTFDAEHAVSFALSGQRQGVTATVTYQGKEQRSDAVLGLVPGVVFLPIRHTELPSTGPPSAHRHFIEVMKWVPVESKWQLEWALFEVVREQLVSVAEDVVAAATGEVPPESTYVDIRSFVSLDLNASGTPEWTILAGPTAGRHAVVAEPTVHAADAAHGTHASGRARPRGDAGARAEPARAADGEPESAEPREHDESVDWSRVDNAQRPPSLEYARADGCGELLVFGWSSSRMEAVALRAGRAVLELSTAPRVFDLSAADRVIDVSVHVRERPQRSWPFCADASERGDGRDVIWHAIGGLLTLHAEPLDVRSAEPRRYRVVVQIDGAELVDASGRLIKADKPIRLAATTGAREEAGLAAAR